PNVTAAHLHNAAAGSNGGVVRSLSGSIVDGAWVSAGVWTASDDTQPLTLDAVRLLVTRQIYINVHTADYGPGEVRGQVLR
ncbi:MAG: CHRD domain-containing protein, partial [Gemmatimonadetes bacterium]|nr:CHRD domain-containing protein [Gemmatimonadota bacterium]